MSGASGDAPPAVDAGLLAGEEEALMRRRAARRLLGDVHRSRAVAVAAFQRLVGLEARPFMLRLLARAVGEMDGRFELGEDVSRISWHEVQNVSVLVSSSAVSKPPQKITPAAKPASTSTRGRRPSSAGAARPQLDDEDPAAPHERRARRIGRAHRMPPGVVRLNSVSMSTKSGHTRLICVKFNQCDRSRPGPPGPTCACARRPKPFYRWQPANCRRFFLPGGEYMPSTISTGRSSGRHNSAARRSGRSLPRPSARCSNGSTSWSTPCSPWSWRSSSSRPPIRGLSAAQPRHIRLAWLVRPIGAVVIGAYADRAGRKPALVLSAGLMMAGTLLTGLLPPYASIGLARRC